MRGSGRNGHRRGLAALAAALVGALSLGVPSAAQAPGRLEIVIRENGRVHGCTGTWEVRGADGGVIASGSHRASARIAPGRYLVAVAIDGVLDRPVRRSTVDVVAGRTTRVEADFATGTVLVQVTRGGQRAAAVVEILRGSARVASLAAGVRGTLSTGTYTLRARHRGEVRETTVQITAGGDAAATLEFPG